MKKLRDIMRPDFLFTVQRDAMVTDAVRLMAERNVGIVIVLDGSRLVGVLSERDVVRRVVDAGRDPAHTSVTEVMHAVDGVHPRSDPRGHTRQERGAALPPGVSLPDPARHRRSPRRGMSGPAGPHGGVAAHGLGWLGSFFTM